MNRKFKNLQLVLILAFLMPFYLGYHQYDNVAEMPFLSLSQSFENLDPEDLLLDYQTHANGIIPSSLTNPSQSGIYIFKDSVYFSLPILSLEQANSILRCWVAPLSVHFAWAAHRQWLSQMMRTGIIPTHFIDFPKSGEKIIFEGEERRICPFQETKNGFALFMAFQGYDFYGSLWDIVGRKKLDTYCDYLV